MVVSLIIIGAIVACAATTGGLFSPDEWYDRLNKPNWTPPGWVFPVVWTTLYIMIAAAGWLVWSTQGLALAMVLWGIQIVLNGMWSWLFFGLRRMDLALLDAALMWLAIAGFIAAAYPVSQIAAFLFAPYLIWVTIAIALNATVWRMNPDPT